VAAPPAWHRNRRSLRPAPFPCPPQHENGIGAEPVQRGLPVTDFDRLHADASDRRLDHGADVRVVVDDEYDAATLAGCQFLNERDQAIATDRLGDVLGRAEREAEVAVIDDGQHDHRDLR
jgi:hypothetical protein